jgi:hypothetical protein
MAFNYFSKLPIIEYPLTSNTNKKARDILHRVFVDQKFIDKSNYTRKYQVNDGDRPEIISNKLYGRTDIYSIIMLLNDFDTTMLSGLPPTSQIYQDYLETKYSDDIYYVVPVNINLLASGNGYSGGYVFPLLGRGFQIGERIFGADAAGFQIYGTRAYVKDWDPVMSALKLDILEGSFPVGLTLANASGSVHFKIAHKRAGIDGVHHFETIKGTTLGTPVLKGSVVDPLSRLFVTVPASAYYIPMGFYNQTIGITGSYGSSIIYQHNLLGDVVPSAKPYIRAVTNKEHEEQEQEKKRKINVPATEKSLLGEVIDKFTVLLESTNQTG